MPVDEFQLRDLARELAGLYRQLNGLKHTHPTPPEVRVMKPAPGPQTPGNWLYVSLYIDQSTKLREVCFNAFSDIGVKLRDTDAAAPRLCHLIAYHAQPISELDWASDLADELEHQARTINRHCNPPEPAAMAKAPEPWQTSEAIIQTCANRGIKVTRETLWNWAKRGTIPTQKRGTRNTYRITDILKKIQG